MADLLASYPQELHLDLLKLLLANSGSSPVVT